MKNHLIKLILLVLALCVALPASAQVTSKKLTPLTISDSSIALSATEVSTSQAIRLSGGKGFSVLPTFVLAAAGTSNVTFNFQVSTDGTTWTTSAPFSYVVAATGTTPVAGFYNFPGTVASNIAYVRLASIQNGNSGGACTISSIVISQDN